MEMENSSLALFKGKEIRKSIHNDEWYFSIVDVIEFLTESPNPSRYWQDLKRKSAKTDGQLYDFSVKLKLRGLDGKNYPSDCANTEGVLRIIMSVPSPKAEPLRMWLAEQGARSLNETANPELLTQRQIDLYRLKGRSDEWIKERMNSITTRNKLTDEWQQRGVQEGKEYSILSAIIAKGTFDVTPSEHKEIKGLKSQNLRDHMTDLELVLTALGEAVTRTVIIDTDAQGFDENKVAAAKGGQAGGMARRNVEEITGRNVVSSENFLPKPKDDDSIELPPSE
jgi:DNA-damage-inducible protein D